jgi:hypothetical protein
LETVSMSGPFSKLNICSVGHWWKLDQLKMSNRRSSAVYNIPCDCSICYISNTSIPSEVHIQTNSMVWVRERTIPTERRRFLAKWLPTFADKGCHVVSVTGPYGRILGFLDRIRYFSIK